MDQAESTHVCESESFEQGHQDNISDAAVTTEEALPVNGEASDDEELVNTTQLSTQIRELQQQLIPLENAERRLQHVIDFMEKALSQSGIPHFRSFWEARSLCLSLFKEPISAQVRSVLWHKYSELSKEVRRLKDVLDEQSAFAVEQIEIAVKALESDIMKLDEQLPPQEPLQLPHPSEALAKQAPSYCNMQYELDLLNSYASRVNALRKELLKTGMRVRKKNQFFQRLSSIGDHIFPRRKERIRELSQLFMTDVDTFITSHFAKEHPTESFFILREEIKRLQNTAKWLTLNTQAFTKTRLQLSECWDKIKHLDKERKQQRAQQRVQFQENAELISQQIKSLQTTLQASEISLAQAQQKVEEIVSNMRKVELGREELRELREMLQQVRTPILEKVEAEEQAKQAEERERAQQRQEKLQQMRQQIELLLQKAPECPLEKLVAEREAVLLSIQSGPFLKMEKMDLERKLKSLRDIIDEKKERDLLSLSDDKKQMLQQLTEVLAQRKERRQEIKAQIEALRKACGTSGLDFERAMENTLQIQAEKERLEKLNQGIQEIEATIAQLKK